MKLSRSIVSLTLLAAAPPAAVLAWALMRIGRLEGAPAPSSVAFAVALTLACVAGAFAVALGFARRVTRPLGACVRGALEIAGGRFGHQVPLPIGNEIGELAYAFNHMSRELETYDRQNRELVTALEAGYLATLRSLATAIDAKDPSTHGHSQRVAELSVAIGRELGVDAETLRVLSFGGLLHDVGKIGVPEAILNKAGVLDPAELEQVRAHPRIGAEILRGVEFLSGALPAVLSHHERWDGTGYPDGLAGEEIPLVARIVNAADTFDASTTPRTYQEVLGPDDALAMLGRMRGTQMDPRVCDALVRVLRQPARRATA